MIKKFKETLLKVDEEAGDDFSGIGIVLSNTIDGVPIFPLHNSNFEPIHDNLLLTLIEISKAGNIHHDGFHFISADLKLTHTSQYFSPPIIKDIKIRQFSG